MKVDNFLNSKGLDDFEGNCSQIPGQISDLISICSVPNINIMEIGFNAGHSADLLLEHSKDSKLTSFDLCSHGYVLTAKEYIDNTYPFRHRLIKGDSRTTVPEFIKNNPDTKFDIIFIDGCHEYDVAKEDLDNCFHLAHKDTIVALDDTMFTEEWVEPWTTGPTKIWSEYLQENKIIELGRNDYSKGRGMVWGKYVK